jgi:transposase, IS30 family
MGKCFNQITREDRIVINHLLKIGISKAKIAEQLNFHRSTIYREIERHSNRLGYMPFLMKRKLAGNRKRELKLDSNNQLRNYVFKKLKLSWSPEQIAGRLKLENKGKTIICHETIYSYLYSDCGIRNRYYLYLRGKRLFRYPKISRRTRTLIPNRVPILERPEEVKYRNSLGHWEGDLMVFGKQTKTNLITLRERQSRYMLAIKNKNRKSEGTAKKIIEAFNKLGKRGYQV